MSGRNAPNSAVGNAGFGSGGVGKGSLGSSMQSQADTTGGGKTLVSGLQSAGARNQAFSGSDTTRGAMDSAGYGSGGLSKGSLGANVMSQEDKSGSGRDLSAPLQSIGAKK